MTRIILTRHGQTLWNTEGRVQGNLDSPLTDQGLLEIRSLARRLKDEGIAYIYSSDSCRAVHSAQEIQYVLGLEKIYLEPALREFGFGEWEGRHWQDLRDAHPDIFKIWDTEPHLITAPGGENMAIVQERGWNFLQKVIDNHSDDTVCIVTHGITLKLMITRALGLQITEWGKTPWQHNTALNIFEVDDKHWVPKLVGDCQHLGIRERSNLPELIVGTKDNNG